MLQTVSVGVATRIVKLVGCAEQPDHVADPDGEAIMDTFLVDEEQSGQDSFRFSALNNYERCVRTCYR